MNGTLIEGARLPVGELSIEHHGWYIKLDARPGDYHPQHVILGGLRRWTYEGQDRVGVLDTSTKATGVTGTEYHRNAGEMCTLERRVEKTKPRVKRYA
jgi:hypothetical protein